MNIDQDMLYITPDIGYHKVGTYKKDLWTSRMVLFVAIRATTILYIAM